VANILQLIGLLLDLTGVVIMATDFMKVDKTIGTWAYDAEKKAIKTKKLTVTGIIFIGLGFLLQALSTAINILGN